jgi:hypothetical protein
MLVAPCLWCGAAVIDEGAPQMELCDWERLDPARLSASRWGHLPEARTTHSLGELSGDPHPPWESDEPRRSKWIDASDVDAAIGRAEDRRREREEATARPERAPSKRAPTRYPSIVGWFHNLIVDELRAQPVGGMTVTASHYYAGIGPAPRPLSQERARGRRWMRLQAAACVGAARGEHLRRALERDGAG